MSSDLMRQLANQASRADPWPLFRRLRGDRVIELDERSYAIGRYDDVLALLHDPRVSSDPHSRADPDQALIPDPQPFIRQDPPGHDQLRREVTRFFGPPSCPHLVTGTEPAIRREVGRLLDALPAAGETDIVDALAYPLPVAVICRLLGVPPADEPRFHEWAQKVVSGLDAGNLEDADEAVRARAEGLAEIFAYLGGLVCRHRSSPDGSMLSGLANDAGPDAMGDTDLQVTGVLMLIAGHETTVNLISNGVLTLLRNPAALDRLRREPGWVIQVVEELLRYEPPVQYLPNRAALDDITIDGTTIPRGSQLTLLVAAANRDPGRFADPDRFDPDRPDNQHLGFGSGLHYCFGAPLARLEAQIALTALASRLGNPRLIEDPPQYRPSPVLRGPLHLRVAHGENGTAA